MKTKPLSSMKEAFSKAHQKNNQVPRPPTPKEFYTKEIKAIYPSLLTLFSEALLERLIRQTEHKDTFAVALDRASDTNIAYPAEFQSYFRLQLRDEFTLYVTLCPAKVGILSLYEEKGVLLSISIRRKTGVSSFHRYFLCENRLETVCLLKPFPSLLGKEPANSKEPQEERRKGGEGAEE